METRHQDIYQYIKSEENSYQLPINILDWEWSMAEHIKTTFYYKHGRLLTGNNPNKPVKNITKPILNLQYRAEDIDVKDILFYIDDPDKYHLSFLIKKYHDDVFLKENNIDEFIDEYKISRIDYGLGLCKDIGKPKPDVIALPSIAFCDQTDILSGPIGLRHFYSPDQLKEMEAFGWGDEKNGATISTDDLIALADTSKKDKDGKETKTPGKYIQVYEVNGTLPERFLTDDAEDNKYVSQMQVVAFYQKENGEKEGVTLFAKKRKGMPFKISVRDPVYGRACGFGGAEELFEDQVWTNYNMIRMKEMLDAAAKTILQTTDAGFAARNNIKNMDNLEVAVLEADSTLSQVDTFPRNISLFQSSTAEWEAHAQQMGAANDSIMGKNPNSGTPFKLQELVTQESHSLHDYRRGQFAKDLEAVYKDWIIPYITKEITKGNKFFSTLDLDEMQQVAEKVITNATNNKIKEMILNGEEIMDEEMEQFKMKAKEEFMKDNRKFIEILEGELEDAQISININIAGKQKDMASNIDKLTNVFRQISANPQILEIPQMAKLFNQIMEGSGLSPIDFSMMKTPVPQTAGQPQQLPQPNINNQQQL